MSRGERAATIDPGLHATGVAIWHMEEFLLQKDREPATAMTVKCADFRAYYDRIRDIFTTWNVRLVLVENPEFQTGVKGNAAARTGSLVKLAEFVGMVMTLGFQRGSMVDFVNVSAWKGSLPKTVVADRVLKIWPECPFTFKDDAMDAIALGFWAQGFINTQLAAYSMPSREKLR